MFLEQLFEEVRNYPCLWNKSKEEYCNQNIRDNTWERISGELEKTGKYLNKDRPTDVTCFIFCSTCFEC